MTLKSDIVELLSKNSGLTDREITDRLRGKAAPQQPVNIACRELESERKISRLKNRPLDNLIGNYLVNIEATVPKETTKIPEPNPFQKVDAGNDHLSEDEIKKIIVDWLEVDGWTTKVAWGSQQGIDVEGSRGKERWIIEVKGPGSRQPMRVNYFLAILGETLQRMDDEAAKYSIALPDMKQYRNLWSRLPDIAKARIGISIIFVDAGGGISELDARKPRKSLFQRIFSL